MRKSPNKTLLKYSAASIKKNILFVVINLNQIISEFYKNKTFPEKIIFTKADRGNRVVAIKKINYISKIYQSISSGNSFVVTVM